MPGTRVAEGMAGLEFLRPDWPAPARVRVATTTRRGGLSAPPYDTLNLAQHVGDDPAAVTANRARVATALGLPGEPLWLAQVHGTRVARHGEGGTPEADAAVSCTAGQVCVVLTADCLPVVFADRAGSRVAVAHAGWRGLADGVLQATIAALAVEPGELLAWLGPAIGPAAFEVGPEVRARFLAQSAAAASAFAPGRGDRWWADLCRLARLQLARAGVGWVGGGGACTHTDAARYFSYRRQPRCGRMATYGWLEPA